jgi:predicted aconitase with swiveling domain
VEENRSEQILETAKWMVGRIHQSILDGQVVDTSDVSELIVAVYFLGRLDELTGANTDSLSGKDLMGEVLKLKQEISTQADADAIKVLEESTKWMKNIRPILYQ